MYGKKRIVLAKRNQIVLAGGKSWIPIGRYIKISHDQIVGRLRNKDNWETKLDDTNSIEFCFSNNKDLRKFVEEQYDSRLKEV